MEERGEKRSWVVRDGNEKDMEGILSLRNDVFGSVEKDKQDPRFWRWEFLEGADGKALIYIVEDGGKIIGHFADIPRRFSIMGELVFGTLSLDLMVHRDYRRQGIFLELGNYAAQRVKKENKHFMTAYPIRPETIRGLKKIGWKNVVKLPVLVYPMKFNNILNHYLHFQPLSVILGRSIKIFYTLLFSNKKKIGMEKIEIEEITQWDILFDHFWQKAISLNQIIGIRDQTYFNWRYFQHPTRTYTIYRAIKGGEMKGYIILRKVALLGFNSAVIVDLLALDEKILMFLVDRGIEFSQIQGVDLLGFMVPRVHPYYKLLRRYGFIPSFKTFLFMIYSHEKSDILFDPQKWYVNWGDTDVI